MEPTATHAITHLDPVVRDRDYNELRDAMQARLEVLGTRRLFITDARTHDAFMAALPESERQHHTCNACRHFLDRWGALVSIDETGETHALWPELHPSNAYARTSDVLRRLVEKSPVVGVLVHQGESLLGLPGNTDSKGREWTHFAIDLGKLTWPRSPIESDFQIACRLRDDYETLQRALATYNPQLVEDAIAILKTDTLSRTEKVLGVAEWIAKLHAARGATKHKRYRDNLVWRAAAEAPAGWCHVKSTMIGTLLDDLAAGVPVPEVTRRWSQKMHPLQYQRPQAAPTSGQIAIAERRVEQLGLAPSLERRFARLEDVEALWRYAAASERQPGEQPRKVFDHLKPNGSTHVQDVGTRPTVMTWAVFARDVLPSASAIDVLAPRAGSYAALVTAVHPDAPPILQWDRPEARNPVSMYQYVQGSTASRWNLAGGSYVRCNAITRDPAHWKGARSSNHAERIYLLLEGARDTEHQPGMGGAFFPETLRAELHEVRAVFEAHAKSCGIAGRNEATACGLVFSPSTRSPQTLDLRVTSGRHRTLYRIDRME